MKTYKYPSLTPEYKRKYYKENKEKINQKRKNRYKTDEAYRQKELKRAKKFYKNNKDKYLEYRNTWKNNKGINSMRELYKIEYQQRDKTKLKEYYKKYYQEHKEEYHKRYLKKKKKGEKGGK